METIGPHDVALSVVPGLRDRVVAGLMTLDQAVEAFRELAPPCPPRWPFHRGGPADIGDLIPLDGPQLKRAAMGWGCEADRYEAAPEGRRRSAVRWPDILASTYPGDGVADVARRLGMSCNGLVGRRRHNPTMADQMDLRRMGAATTGV